MEKRISVQQADIKTATIDVKVLSLNNRNLTLSVFRQIPVGNLIDPKTIALNGTVWGQVNYYWGDYGKFADSPLHTHILWATPEGELRRSIISKKMMIPPKDLFELLMEDGSIIYEQRYHHQYGNPQYFTVYDAKAKTIAKLYRQALGEHLAGRADELCVHSVNSSNYGEYLEQTKVKVKEDPFIFSGRFKEIDRLFVLNSIPDMSDRMSQMDNDYETFRKIVTQIFSSDQLFIAV